MRIGWEYVSWSAPARPCVVGSCDNVAIHSGHVRVDHAHPENGDPVICVRCWTYIQAGIDPDDGAVVPEWELKNRAERLKEITGGS